MVKLNASIRLGIETSDPISPDELADRIHACVVELTRMHRAIRAHASNEPSTCTVNMVWSTDQIPDCELCASVGNVGIDQ